MTEHHNRCEHPKHSEQGNGCQIVYLVRFTEAYGGHTGYWCDMCIEADSQAVQRVLSVVGKTTE